MNIQPIHTSDALHAARLWRCFGGDIEPIRRTGELRYTHSSFEHPLRVNGRRRDVPAKLLSRINQLARQQESMRVSD